MLKKSNSCLLLRAIPVFFSGQFLSSSQGNFPVCIWRCRHISRCVCFSRRVSEDPGCKDRNAELVRIAIEWPLTCRYWKHLAVRQFRSRHKLGTTKIHGCAYGLTDARSGAPLLKPWRIDTDVVHFCRSLNKLCPNLAKPGTHVHGECRGG